MTRRTFTGASIVGAGALGTDAGVMGMGMGEAASPQNRDEGISTVRLRVNGRDHEVAVDTRTTLLDALRDHLGYTGPKKGCDHGQCGACTVLSEGRRMNSCLSLAVMHEGGSITTIEGVARDGELHPMQAAFVSHDGFQCGFCTSGQILSAIAMLDEIGHGVPSAATVDLETGPNASDAEIRERMSGNICRCGAYVNIVKAVRGVAQGAAGGSAA